MKPAVTRRELLHAAGAAVLGRETARAADERHPLPERPLGKTGFRLPILGFGTAPAGIRRGLGVGAKLYHEALDSGIRYFDTAPMHTGYGRAQAQLGEVLKTRRSEVFLVTKCFTAEGDAALRLLERSLKELKTDHADLVHVHSLGALDPDVAMGRGGVLPALMKAKERGLLRFVGLSGHHRPAHFVRVLRHWDVDVVMTAANFVDRHTYGFEERVWPAAARKHIGLVAMKVFGGMRYDLPGMTNSMMPREHLQAALRYALSLPQVSVAVAGMATSAELRQNLAWVRDYQPLTPEERRVLLAAGKRLAAQWKAHLGAVA